MCEIAITNHAYKRLKQRNGWGRKTSERMMERVVEKGKRFDDLTGYAKKWLKMKQAGVELKGEFIVYGKQAYFIADKALITVLQIPSRVTCLRKEGRVCAEL